MPNGTRLPGGPIDEGLRVGGGARAIRGSSDAARPAPVDWSLTRRAPEEEPPPGASSINQFAALGTVGAGDLQTLLDFTLDANSLGVVKSLDFFLSNVAATTTLSLALLFGETVVRGFEKVAFFPASSPVQSINFSPLSLPVGAGARVRVISTNGDGGAYTVGARLFGWQWPSAIDARYRPEGVGVR